MFNWAVNLEAFWADEQSIDSETVELMEGQEEFRENSTVIGNGKILNEEIADPFFQHDSQNYLEVDFTDDEQDPSDALIVDEFSDNDSEKEVERSLLQ